MDETIQIKIKYMVNNPLRVDKECEDILNNVLLNIMRYNFQCELGGDGQ